MQGGASLIAIGVVHSTIKDTAEMPLEGVTAEIEIYPQFAAALQEIESNSHLIILGWLHMAEREKTVAKGRAGKARRGVFGLRSAARPNPVGMDVVRLARVDYQRRSLLVEQLDFVDGTEVVDIKRYSPAWDSVFAATTSRDTSAGERSAADWHDELARAAVNFHGEWCRGAALGVKLLAEALQSWQTGPRNPDVLVHAGADYCLADTLQGITGATLGKGRLLFSQNLFVTVSLRDKESWVFQPASDLRDAPDELVKRRLDEFGQLAIQDYKPQL